MYAAIQILEGETSHVTVERIMKASAYQGVKYAQLDVLGIVKLGRAKLLRFRVEAPTFLKVIHSFAPYRMVIFQEGGGYVVTVPEDGTRSPINSLTMQCVAEPLVKKTYRGVGVKYWERQFL